MLFIDFVLQSLSYKRIKYDLLGSFRLLVPTGIFYLHCVFVPSATWQVVLNGMQTTLHIYNFNSPKYHSNYQLISNLSEFNLKQFGAHR